MVRFWVREIGRSASAPTDPYGLSWPLQPESTDQTIKRGNLREVAFIEGDSRLIVLALNTALAKKECYAVRRSRQDVVFRMSLDNQHERIGVFCQLGRWRAMPVPRILVADDHPVVLEGLRRSLVAIPAEVDWAVSLDEVRQKLKEQAYDLVILDVDFRDPRQTGFTILIDLGKTQPKTPVILFSAWDDPFLQVSARQFGARGFVSKLDSSESLLTVARVVLEGGTSFAHPRKRAGRFLSRRQVEVSRLILRGLEEKEAAKELGISLSMVQKHVRMARKAMDARHLAHLATEFSSRGFHLLPTPHKRKQ